MKNILIHNVSIGINLQSYSDKVWKFEDKQMLCNIHVDIEEDY